ncbi:MAG: prolipoprotein diacylglyceryl transferase [Deltaproteobacteria bacterium]|nr:prolipoprotein diacylglyceryl transferase [Deltaproteobacteria bacterium]
MDFTWDVAPVLLHGPTPLRFYGLLMGLALIGGFFIWRWQVIRAGHAEETAAIFLAYGLVAVIVGARLGHCLFYDFGRCFGDVWTVFKVWRGGLASHGAAIGLVIALLIYVRRHKLPLVDTFDRLAISTAWGAMCVRIGNFFNSEIVGRPTGASWGVRFPRFDRVPALEAPLRHPVQLYEAGLALGVLMVLLIIDRKLGEARPRGLLASLFFLLYFGGRLYVERFKAFQTLDPSSPLTMGQILSIAPAALGLAGLLWVVWRGVASMRGD